LAYDPVLKRRVALKIPRPECVLSQQMRSRFEREAAAMAKLSHPNLVTVLEAGTIGPACFIAQEYVEGEALSRRIRERGRMSPAEAAAVIAQIAGAVQFVHQQKIIHRDIKPDNILLDMAATSRWSDTVLLEYTPKLTDFGLAKWLEDSPQLTRTLTAVGTPAYMAPEQIDGSAEGVGPTADVYALGATLYQMLTGQPPYRGHSTWDTFRQVKDGQVAAPRRLAPAVPRDLEAICLKCLELEPAHRYGSAQQLAEDLERFLNNEPVEARPMSGLRRSAKWARRKPLVALLLLLLMGSLVGGFSAIAWQWRSAEAERARAAANFNLAHQGIRDVYGVLSQQPRLKHYKFNELRRSLRQKVLNYYGDLRERNAGSPQIDRDIADVYYDLAHESLAGGNHEAAIELCRESIPRWQRLAEQSADRNGALYFLAQTQRILGMSLARSGVSFDEAIVPIQKSSALLEELVAAQADSTAVRSALADSYQAEASLHRLSDRLDRSSRLAVAALEQRREAMRLSPDDPSLQRRMAEALYLLGAQHYAEGQYLRVEDDCVKAIALLEGLFSAENQQPTIGVCLARCLRLYAGAAEQLGKHDFAARLNQRQKATLLRLSAMFPLEKQVTDALRVLDERTPGE
jgi:tRNA A-37 threonylcarbamoyl transferase component Bud32